MFIGILIAITETELKPAVVVVVSVPVILLPIPPCAEVLLSITDNRF
jgi:hypothetical protein